MAHPASNIAATVSDRNFTVRSLAPLTLCARRRHRCGRFKGVPFNDRRRYPQATATNYDGLFLLCKQLTDKGEIETSSRLIPLVDQFTHILIEAGKSKLQ